VRAKALLVLLCLSGCKLYFGDPAEDEPSDGQRGADGPDRPRPDAAVDQCLAPSERANLCRVDVTGRVVDYVTRAAYGGGAEVEITTGWDTVPPFAPDCPPLQATTADESGAFAVMDAICDSPLYPPVLLLRIAGGGGEARAPTAIDSTLGCSPATPSDCGAFDGGALPVPSQTTARTWRNLLSAEGMPAAAAGGLVVLEFLDLDGTPAAGVLPFVLEGGAERMLVPPREVRFLAADRETLVRSDAGMTGTSGTAFVALEGMPSAFVGGTRGGQRWEPTGVLFADGWIVVESRSRAP
jgi:hypothetical protein